MPEENFRKLFRLSREAARDFVNELLPFMEQNRRATAIPNVLKIMTTLHFYAHGSYQKSIGKDYNSVLSQASVSRCITVVSTVITEHLVQRYIKYPTTNLEINFVKQRFYQKFQFPGIIGAIDGTHISIVPPPANDPVYPGLVYINRKGFHSINCQIICDSDLKILALNARYPGSVHDAAIWATSNIKQFMERKYRNGEISTWLIGDSGYPLQPFLLTPVIGAPDNSPESRYTRRHCTARNSVERCIGVYKNYFRCLSKDRTLHYSPRKAAYIIYACAVLYNILRMRGLAILENIQEEIPNDNFQHIEPAEIDDWLDIGRQTRQNFIREHFN